MTILKKIIYLTLLSLVLSFSHLSIANEVAEASSVAQEQVQSGAQESTSVEKLPEYKPLSQASRSGALSTGLNTPGGIIQWFLSTIGVLVFIFLIAFFIKRSKFIQRTVGTMHVNGQLVLGPKERLVKVNVDGKSLLLGVTANNISLIYDFSKEENGAQSSENTQTSVVQNRHKNINAIMQSLNKVNAPDLEASPYAKPPRKAKKAWYQSKQDFYAQEQKEQAVVEDSKEKESQESKGSDNFKEQFNHAYDQQNHR